MQKNSMITQVNNYKYLFLSSKSNPKSDVPIVANVLACAQLNAFKHKKYTSGQ